MFREDKVCATKKEEEKKEKLQSTCQFCYRMFLNKNACDRHEKKIHNENKDTDEASYLKKNVEGFDKKCPHCKRCFKYEFSRVDYVKRFHSDVDMDEKDVTEHRCNLCEEFFNHRIFLKRLMISHSEVVPGNH